MITILSADDWRGYLYRRDYMQNCVIPAFRKSGLDTLNLEMCGISINAIECNSCQTNHFAGFKRCKSRWCSNCNHLRSLLWMAKLYPVVSEWINAGNNVFKLNFTVKDTESIREGLDLLNMSWRNMTHGDKTFRKYWKNRFIGGVRSLEIKLGKNSNDWHPHLHCLVMADATFQKDYEYIKENWEHFTRKFYSKVLREDDEKFGSVYLKGIGKKNVLKELAETVKYITKFDDCIQEVAEAKSKSVEAYPNRLMELVFELKGKRSINTWGMLRGLDKKVDEELDNWEEKKLTEFVCQLCGCTVGQLKSYLYTDVQSQILFDLR